MTSVGMIVDDEVAVTLRSGLGAAMLTIGDEVEILLTEAHVRSLCEQAVTVLGDLRAIELAGQAVDSAECAGARADLAATRAFAAAEAATRAVNDDLARQTREAARSASDAADRVRTTVAGTRSA
ncbi:hypothetical protein [Saccharothrix violaceirubra]|uniref:Uncharacterized protein n=1 Tax=Saccharothrix violaceirubra TaxID=413306 RepID=A0A7W7WUW5_9PSEU|nr:hypothetical protein [Saccharothrix violaceirubra]MBB4964684.1 hypothetical protein [Saccharothrix violaceirubra]